MALTHELDDRESPVRRYLLSRCPIIEGTKRGIPFAAERQEALGLGVVPKEACIKPLVASPIRGVVGTALDYRVRYYLGMYAAASTIAAEGAQLLAQEPLGTSAARLAGSFFALHDRLLKRIAPVRRRLAQADEDRLARHCIVLTYYEQIFRAGPFIGSPLYTLGTKASVDDLTALVPEECIADVRQLSWAFEEDVRHYFDLAATLNPTFDGSYAIGGADADFMLGSTLWELKTLASARPMDLRNTLYQLLGYALLDYSDTLGIRELAIYLPRQRHIWRAPIWAFLLPDDEARRLLSAGREPDARRVNGLLRGARKEFSEIVELLPDRGM
ncbi:hypothetical protein EPN42_04820 [bacterium]|nr:MAG: hypothetical protein EPN42_04820 [bacterium]